MNLRAIQTESKLEEIISGWYINMDEIVSKIDPGKYVKDYKEIKRFGNYMIVRTKLGKGYIFWKILQFFDNIKEISSPAITSSMTFS